VLKNLCSNPKPNAAYYKKIIRARIEFVFFLVGAYYGIDPKVFLISKKNSRANGKWASQIKNIAPDNFREIKGMAYFLIKKHYQYSYMVIAYSTNHSSNWISTCYHKYASSKNSENAIAEKIISEQITKCEL
jgi:hypothetical protein